jgi:glycosyltransferase involved in cell wall biosynthesis
VPLSVIVPAHNAAGTVRRCVDSLLAQGVEGMEILLVDAGSTDGTGGILDGFAAGHPDRVRVLHLPDVGVSAARNAGLAAARGAYIGFVDSDDYAAPGMYARLCALMDAEGCDLAVCAKYLVRGTEVRVKAHAEALRGGGVFPVSGEQALCMLLDQLSNFVWDKLFRADLIRAHGLQFPEAFSYSEDFAFLAQYLSYARSVRTTDEPLYYYDQGNPHSISNSASERWADAFGCFALLVDAFRARGMEAAVRAVCRVAFRTYDYRVNSFYRFSAKGIQRAYVRTAFRFLEESLPGWRSEVAAGSGVLFPRIKARKALMLLYVWLPNVLKKPLLSRVERRAWLRNPSAQ